MCSSGERIEEESFPDAHIKSGPGGDVELVNEATAKNAVRASSKSSSAMGSFKMMLLVLMVAQNSALALVGRYTRSSVSKADMYVVNHLILTCECVKLLLSLVLEYKTTGGKLIQSIKENIIDTPLDFCKILVPSLLYLVQNSLGIVALTNLPAPLYQVTYQMKVLTTALVSVLMLQRRYVLRQWVCLLTLGIGVAIVVLGETDQGKEGKESGGEGEAESDRPSQNMVVGIVSVAIACCSSALAGVYTEKLLKKPAAEAGSNAKKQPVSLWMRNIQMAFFSICIALVQTTKLSAADAEKPFMHGFTFWVYALVMIQAAGGLLVAAVMKYADNVLKGLATGVSVVVATLISMVLFATPITGQFAVGAAIVLGSVYFFSNEMPSCSRDAAKGANESNVEMEPLTKAEEGGTRV